MSDMDINRMDFKKLRNEVQNLRDELAVFKRKYEDTINNLDSDNFGKSFTVEQDNMRSQIKITAEAITSMVSNKEFNTAIVQAADKILQIATEIVDTSKAEEVTSSDDFTDPTKIYVIRDYDGDEVADETFYYYNTISKDWKEIKDNEVKSLFEQTSDGFKLRGDVRIDGRCVLTDSLTFDSADKPVQVQYSVDGKSDWHDTFNSEADMFMRLKIGADWSDAMKIVAKDGEPGSPGSNATVDATDVFNLLTQDGANEGVFSAFYAEEDEDGKDHLFINATYVKTGTLDADRVDTENLSCTKLYAKNNPDGYSVRLNGNFGDFGVFNSLAGDSSSSTDKNCMFGVFNKVPNIIFYVYGHDFMGFDTEGDKIWAKGAWDFSGTDCSVAWGHNAPAAIFG